MNDKSQDAEKLRREDKLDQAVEQTFPASDPPANTPIAGTRKAEQIEKPAGRDA